MFSDSVALCGSAAQCPKPRQSNQQSKHRIMNMVRHEPRSRAACAKQRGDSAFGHPELIRAMESQGLLFRDMARRPGRSHLVNEVRVFGYGAISLCRSLTGAMLPLSACPFTPETLHG